MEIEDFTSHDLEIFYFNERKAVLKCIFLIITRELKPYAEDLLKANLITKILNKIMDFLIELEYAHESNIHHYLTEICWLTDLLFVINYYSGNYSEKISTVLNSFVKIRFGRAFADFHAYTKESAHLIDQITFNCVGLINSLIHPTESKLKLELDELGQIVSSLSEMRNQNVISPILLSLAAYLTESASDPQFEEDPELYEWLKTSITNFISFGFENDGIGFFKRMFDPKKYENSVNAPLKEAYATVQMNTIVSIASLFTVLSKEEKYFSWLSQYVDGFKCVMNALGNDEKKIWYEFFRQSEHLQKILTSCHEIWPAKNLYTILLNAITCDKHSASWVYDRIKNNRHWYLGAAKSSEIAYWKDERLWKQYGVVKCQLVNNGGSDPEDMIKIIETSVSENGWNIVMNSLTFCNLLVSNEEFIELVSRLSLYQCKFPFQYPQKWVNLHHNSPRNVINIMKFQENQMMADKFCEWLVVNLNEWYNMIKRDAFKAQYDFTTHFLNTLLRLVKTKVTNLEIVRPLVDFLLAAMLSVHDAWKYESLMDRWNITYTMLKIINTHLDYSQSNLLSTLVSEPSFFQVLITLIAGGQSHLYKIVEDKPIEAQLFQNCMLECLTLVSRMLKSQVKLATGSPSKFEETLMSKMINYRPVILAIFEWIGHDYSFEVPAMAAKILVHITRLAKDYSRPPSLVGYLGENANEIVEALCAKTNVSSAGDRSEVFRKNILLLIREILKYQKGLAVYFKNAKILDMIQDKVLKTTTSFACKKLCLEILSTEPDHEKSGAPRGVPSKMFLSPDWIAAILKEKKDINAILSKPFMFQILDEKDVKKEILHVMEELKSDFTTLDNLEVLKQIDMELMLDTQTPKKKRVTFNETLSEATPEQTSQFMTQFLSATKGFDLVKLKRFFPERDLKIKQEFNIRWKRIIANLEILKDIKPFPELLDYITLDIPYPRLFAQLSRLYYTSLSQVFLKPMLNESHAITLKNAIQVQIHRHDDENLFNLLFLFVKFQIPFPDERVLVKVLRNFDDVKIAQLSYLCLQECEMDPKTVDFLYSEMLKSNQMIQLSDFNVDLLTCLNFKPSRFTPTLIQRLPWSIPSLIFVNSMLSLKGQPNIILLDSCKKFFWMYQDEISQVLNLDIQRNAKTGFYVLLFYYHLTRFGLLSFDKFMVRALFKLWNSKLAIASEDVEFLPILLDGLKCIIKIIILMMDIPQGPSSRNVNYILENNQDTKRTFEVAIDQLLGLRTEQDEIKKNAAELMLDYLVVASFYFKKGENKSDRVNSIHQWKDYSSSSLPSKMKDHMEKMFQLIFNFDKENGF